MRRLLLCLVAGAALSFSWGAAAVDDDSLQKELEFYRGLAAQQEKQRLETFGPVEVLDISCLSVAIVERGEAHAALYSSEYNACLAGKPCPFKRMESCPGDGGGVGLICHNYVYYTRACP